MYHADPVEHAAYHYEKLEQKNQAFQRYKEAEELQFWRDIRAGNYTNAMEVIWWSDHHKTEFTQRAIQALFLASGHCKHCRAVLNDMAESFSQSQAENREMGIMDMYKKNV